jgi:superfamily I DNA/RNA helicase
MDNEFFIDYMKLDDFQRQSSIDRHLDKSMIVSGCVGSGKTTIALWKAKQIQDGRRDTYWFIVFTKTLMQYISNGARAIGININNIDYYWSWKNRHNSPEADYIIIDDAQNFSEEDILLFKSKSKKALFLFGDSASQIFLHTNNFPHISMEEISVLLTSYSIDQLYFSHSLPKKIARLAQYIGSAGDEFEYRCKNEGIEKPRIIGYDSFNAQLDDIVRIIKTREYMDVGILFRNKNEIEHACHYLYDKDITVETNIDVEPLSNPYLSWKSKETKQYLKNNDISIKDIAIHDLYLPPEQIYQELKQLRIFFEKDQLAPKKIDFNSNNPKLLTYHGSVGLHFETVFLPQCTSEERAPLYVAITRATQSLYIMHSGNLSNLFQNIPNNLYNTNK